MKEMEKLKVSNYCIKMQIYPSAAQKDKIEKIFRALHIAYNITFHEVFQKNKLVCTEPNEDGAVWPDYKKITNKKWIDYLRECNSIVKEAPAEALTTNNGLFLTDAKRAWKTGMHNRPVDPTQRGDFRFYSSNKPRCSFMVRVPAQNIMPSSENKKVAWIILPTINGRIKARGFNRKVWFGEKGKHTYAEALGAQELAEKLTVRVSRDTCGDYYVSVTFSQGKKNEHEIYLETLVDRNPAPMGIDVGIKDVAILSNGEKIENKHFKKKEDVFLRRLNRQLSRRWGPTNMGYQDYNRELRKETRQNEEPPPKVLSKPSKRYLITRRKKARLERKIARRRNTYYHQKTAMLVRQCNMIAIETLHVKNMLRNHKLAYALSDAAMSDLLEKIKYKAERRGVKVVTIGMFEPSSQRCFDCKEIYPPAKKLSIRFWTCPKCGARHDRDVNAAKNILAAAEGGGAKEDMELLSETKAVPVQSRSPRTRMKAIFEDRPNIVVSFSKKLTRINDPRYVILDQNTKHVLDDGQGFGFRSVSSATNYYKAKRKREENGIIF